MGGIKSVTRKIVHAGDWVACNVFRIDTASAGAYFLDMYKDSNDVYHANFDCWQAGFGYNDGYDFLFDIGTSMDKAKFFFNYNGDELVFWAWKGDYINLGAGAELGIYKRLEGYGVSTPQWIVDKDLALTMTLTLKYKGNIIIQYNPGKQWWITGFNPSYKDVKTSDLTAIYTIDFSGNKDMFDAFYKSDARENGWKFDTKNYTASLEF